MNQAAVVICTLDHAHLQAFGAKNYKHMGVLLQRALLICTLGMACTLAVWSQLDRFLLLAGRSPHAAHVHASNMLCAT